MMSSYKVLPPYSDIISLHRQSSLELDLAGSEQEGTCGQLFGLPLDSGYISSSPETFSLVLDTDTNSLQPGTFQNLQTLVEVSSLLSGGGDGTPTPTEGAVSHLWAEQDGGVRHLQAALNSQPNFGGVSWGDPHTPPEETLDLSTAHRPTPSPQQSPLPRPTILPQRMDTPVVVSNNVVMGHPVSSNQQYGYSPPSGGPGVVQYVNLNGELVLGEHGGESCMAEKRTRAKSRDKAELMGPRPCKVCGEKAGKHSYYGGQVCPSCRAFFRRSVQSGYNATYFCVKEGRCEITLKTRKNCQYCRYKLCEAAGMKTSWVLTDAERKQKFENRGKRKSSSSESNPGDMDRSRDDSGACTSGGISPRKVGISDQELASLDSYVRASNFFERSKVGDMDTSLIRQIIRMVAFRAHLDGVGQEQLKKVILARSRKFANNLSEFQELSMADKSEILSNNLPILMKLKTCSFFSPGLDWTNQLSSLLGVGEVEKLNTKLRSLNVTGLDNLQLSYKQFFCSPFMHTEESEVQFTELLTNIGSWPQDEKEYVLVSLVLLFCPDQLDLTDRRRVEDLQEKFATLLQKYLIHKHQPDSELARSRFTSGMLLVTKCKELHNLCVENKINLELTLEL